MFNMRDLIIAIVAVVAFGGPLIPSSEAQTAIRNGRIDRTLDVREFDDFEVYLPNSTKEIAVYAQWSNNQVVVLNDISLLCLYGPDGLGGDHPEDDDLTFGNSRASSYKVMSGRMWYTTTVSGQRCWLTLDFQHYARYDRSARAKFTIIVSELDATEETWDRSTAQEIQMRDMKKSRMRSPTN